MAKYSTNNNDKPDVDADDASCELCGKSDNLTTRKLSGAVIIICKECSEKSTGDNEKLDESSEDKTNKNTNKVPNTGHLSRYPDSSWVEKDRADYGNMDKPYMKQNYSDILEKEIDKYEKSISELCEEIDINEKVLKYVIEGSVIKNNIDKDQINKIEDYFGVELQDA